MKIYKQIILYERVQVEYDEFIAQLMQLDEKCVVGNRIYEMRLKTIIIEEMYAEKKVNYLLEQEDSLNILYRLMKESL